MGTSRRMNYKASFEKRALKSELCDSIQIEDFYSELINRNRDLVRSTRHALDDWGIDKKNLATHRHELLGKRIMKALWEEYTADSGIEILTDARINYRAIDLPSQSRTRMKISFTSAMPSGRAHRCRKYK